MGEIAIFSPLGHRFDYRGSLKGVNTSSFCSQTASRAKAQHQRFRPRIRTVVRDIIHRNNRFYGFLLDICRLVWLNLLPNEQTGTWTFRDFFRDNARQMGHLC
jgi:hypothetical protein